MLLRLRMLYVVLAASALPNTSRRMAPSKSLIMFHRQGRTTTCRISSSQPSLSAVSLSSMGTDNDSDQDEEDDEEEEEPSSPTEMSESRELEHCYFKNWDVDYLLKLEEDGRLELKPYYQRGYKWTQRQASLWIDSVLRGYPCIPEITLLQSEDDEGNTQYATFDGQQRLTSIKLYIKNLRPDHWRQTKKQAILKTDNVFALEGVTMFTQFENMTFKDLPKREQNRIRNYGVRCAIIPSSWTMADYMEYFKRIQGGGTPMTDHELRRAISRGPFTELLDEIAEYETVKKAVHGSNLGQDDIQQLLLGYFSVVQFGRDQFGKPSLAEQGLQTMKLLNKEMQGWEASVALRKRKELQDPLLKALELATAIFHEAEPFRRVAPLIKKGKVLNPNKIWMDTSKINRAIFVCMIYGFAREEIRKHGNSLFRRKDSIRSALIDLMQTDPSFTDSLDVRRTSERIRKVEETLYKFLDTEKTTGTRELASISRQTRRDLIANARAANQDCPLCGQHIGPFDEHLHIDHIHPRAHGGSNDSLNLQVVHKTCNLRKSDKILAADIQT